MKTMDNLQTAFAGESQANRKYLAFAKVAEKDGYPQLAKLFRAVATAETVHAHNHFRVMGGIGSTEENLKAAIGGENYEVTSMYPAMIADAEAEGEKKALQSFTWAREVEMIHEKLYNEALENLGQETEAVDYWVCPICGHTHVGAEPPDVCPICGTKGEKYMQIA